MAQDNKVTEEAPKTPAEMKAWFETNQHQYRNFAEANDALKNLRNVNKTTRYRTISSFSKDSLRTYLQAPSSNESNLRNLSRYLYYRSQPYYKLIAYNANMFDLSARTVIPSYDLVGDNDSTKVLKSYSETLQILDKMNLQYEFLKAYTTCFREDVFYGCVYFDPKAAVGSSMFVLPLDPDYCKISGVYDTGDFAFAMDMSYFRSKPELLEYWGDPFQSMYNEYESSGEKWQPMQDEYALCLKARAEDWETVVPVFSGLLNSIISLIDMEDIAAIAEEESIYKLIWLKMETMGDQEPDNWSVNPTIMVDYFNKMTEGALPPYISAAIVPGELNTISFDDEQKRDVDRIAEATETLFNTSGGAQILNSSTISGTTAFTAATKADSEFAISMLLPQTQNWVNRFLSYQVKNAAKVKFFETSVYTKEELKKSMLEAAQYGLPTKLAYNTLNGFTELDTLALNYLEEDCLNLVDKFVPLQSSHTQSGSSDTGGAPTKDLTDLTDDGEASQDKTDNKN